MLTIAATSFNEKFDKTIKTEAIQRLEQGNLLYFPNLDFKLLPEEESLLTHEILGEKTQKNIVYIPKTKELKGNADNQKTHKQLKNMLHRYSESASSLIQHLFPGYQSSISIGRTSFRPEDVEERYQRQNFSYRKDDRLLHIDAFPSTPTQGQRILRVFTNINPNNKPRVWRTGEPFEQLANRFSSQLKLRPQWFHHLLHLIHITRKLRTQYDSLMLQLHNMMKGDVNYQKNVDQQTIELPAYSSWIVFTDQVSHAAVSGSFCLEQTFYLPQEALHTPNASPLSILEKLKNRKLT